MKKIYLFYLYDKQDKMNTKIYPAITDSNIIKGNNFYHVLYAWTPNKEIRKQFKTLRNMSKFKEVVHEIDREDFDKFSDENSDTFLEERSITTKKITDDGKISKQNIYILSTKKELDIMIDDKLIIVRNQLECLVSLDIYLREEYFAEKYRKMLSFFNLNNIMSYAYPLDDSDIPFNTTTEDTLAIYSHLYHNTYRKDINAI